MRCYRNDAESIRLFQACMAGERLRSVRLTCRRGPLEFLVVTLTDAIVTAVDDAGSEADGRVTERASFRYQRIVFNYTPQKPNGLPGTPLTGGWDVRANTRI